MTTKAKITLAPLFLPALFACARLPSGVTWAQDDAPVWQVGDWWVIQQEQQPVWKMSVVTAWANAGRFRFTVKDRHGAGDQERITIEVVRVDSAYAVRRRKLSLAYSRKLALVDGNLEVGRTSIPMPRAANYVPLGAGGLDVSALNSERVKTTPTPGSPLVERHHDSRTQGETLFHRVELEVPTMYDTLGVKFSEHQLWLPNEPWWRFYERSYGVPVRAEMIDCSYWH